MWKHTLWKQVSCKFRSYSRIAPPPPAYAQRVIRVSNNISQLGSPKDGPKARQLLSLPPFPGHPLPGRSSLASHVTVISWVKYYFDEILDSVIQSHFKKGLVHIECRNGNVSIKQGGEQTSMIKVKPNDVMEVGTRVHIPVSVVETKISKRFDTIPSGTLYPNADEIEYLQRLVKYKDTDILVLNKPPRLPVKGNLPVHNSMDALAASALSYDYDEGPKLVQRLDKESSGLLLMGRTKESIGHLEWLFNDVKKSSSWCKVLLNDGKSERVVLAQNSGLEPAQDALTEYRVLGPTINGCSWIELCPLTSRKHQLRVHCAEALGTPIVGDYKYGWFVHQRWKQMPRVDVEPFTGKPYKLRRPEGIDVQKGSVLSKVPLLHLHCRELVLPNISKFRHVLKANSEDLHPSLSEKPDVLRFVGSMPTHMKISWNLMSSYLV